MITYKKEIQEIVNAMHQEYFDINEDVIEKIDNILITLVKKNDEIPKSA